MEGAERYQEYDKSELISIILDHEQENQKLRNLIHNANRERYGKKSEKLSPEQAALFSFEAATESEPEKTTVKEHPRIVRGRKPLPDNLPRERIEHEPEARTCSCCGEELVKIGEEITEELEYVPATLKVVEHVRIKRACPRCKDGVVKGVLPAGVQPLERSRPGVGLLTHIMLSKHADHVPLYRQEQIFLRLGIELSRRRMSDWIERIVDDYLVLLWRALKAETLAARYVQADETYIKVRDLELIAEKHELDQGYFWAVHAPPGLAFFEYHADRAGDSAKEVLKGFEGVVQTDAYAGYNPVLLPEKVVRLACMAHIRRKFVDGRNLAPADCDRVLKKIAELYLLERRWKALSPTERLAKRQQEATPVFEQLKTMIENLSKRLLPNHNLQEGLRYAIKQMEPMKLYLSNGAYYIDNNPVEREIRPIAIGRKNYLFAGSHDGARRAAVLYSLLACCKLNKINPRDWLTDILKRLPSYPVNRVGELLPHRWPASAA